MEWPFSANTGYTDAPAHIVQFVNYTMINDAASLRRIPVFDSSCPPFPASRWAIWQVAGRPGNLIFRSWCGNQMLRCKPNWLTVDITTDSTRR